MHKLPKLATLMDGAEEDVLAYMGLRPFLPQTVHQTVPLPADRRELLHQHCNKLYSTNPIKRLNGEIERRTDVAGIFPNEASIRRRVGAILMEQTEEWTLQRGRYMTREMLAPLCDDLTVSLPAAQSD